MSEHRYLGSDRTTNEVNGAVGIVASAGGVAAVSHVLANLPGDFPLPILVLQHVGRQSQLAQILQKRCALSLRWASSGDLLRAASVYVTPPESALSIEVDGTISLFPMCGLSKFFAKRGRIASEGELGDFMGQPLD